MSSSLYHISGEVVKEETEEMPKEVGQNGLENSEKGRSFFRKLILIIDEILKSSFLKIDAQVEVFFQLCQSLCQPRHGEESSWRTLPDQSCDKNRPTLVYGELVLCMVSLYTVSWFCAW